MLSSKKSYLILPLIVFAKTRMAAVCQTRQGGEEGRRERREGRRGEIGGTTGREEEVGEGKQEHLLSLSLPFLLSRAESSKHGKLHSAN